MEITPQKACSGQQRYGKLFNASIGAPLHCNVPLGCVSNLSSEMPSQRYVKYQISQKEPRKKLSSLLFVWQAQGLGWNPESIMVSQGRVSRDWGLAHQPSEETNVIIYLMMLLFLVPHRRKRILCRF